MRGSSPTRRQRPATQTPAFWRKRTERPTRQVDLLAGAMYLESKGLEPEAETFKLEALLSEIADFFTPQAETKGVDLRVFASRALVHTDPTRDDGLELGLSIVKRTAEILGYRLTVRSVLHKGSCFGLEVPLAEPRKPTRAAE